MATVIAEAYVYQNYFNANKEKWFLYVLSNSTYIYVSYVGCMAWREIQIYSDFN